MFINKPLTSPEQMLFESHDEALVQEFAFLIRFCIGLRIFLSWQDWFSRSNEEI